MSSKKKSSHEASESDKVSRIPGRDFGNAEIAEAEAEQAEGRRESMATRDNMFMGPHDQEFSTDPQVREPPDERQDSTD